MNRAAYLYGWRHGASGALPERQDKEYRDGYDAGRAAYRKVEVGLELRELSDLFRPGIADVKIEIAPAEH